MKGRGSFCIGEELSDLLNFLNCVGVCYCCNYGKSGQMFIHITLIMWWRKDEKYWGMQNDESFG